MPALASYRVNEDISALSGSGCTMKSSLTVCFSICAQLSAGAQETQVAINQLLLSHKAEGWTVTESGSRYAELHPQDSIVELDGLPSAAIGAFTLINVFDESFTRPIHVTVKRGNKTANIQLKSVEEFSGPLKSRLAASSGFTAPEFETHDLLGRRLSLSEFGTKWVLLAFGASWCAECRAQISYMRKLQEQYHDNLAIVMLALDDKEENLQALVAKEQVGYPVVNLGDSFSPVPVEYGVSSPKGNEELPTDFLIRPDHSIALVQVGSTSPSKIYEFVKMIIDQSHK